MYYRMKKFFKLFGLIALIVFLVYFLLNTTNLIKRNTGTFMIENGSLSYEEEIEGYIIREEEVLKGNNSSNGLNQIVPEGTRVAKKEAVFRYFSKNEESLSSQIEEIDKKIDEAIQNNENPISSIDISNLEKEIKKELNNIYKANSLQVINEYKKRINNYIIKKAEIAGDLSPAGSYIKDLVEQRTELSKKLTRRFRNYIFAYSWSNFL